MGENILRGFVISFVSARNYLFKVSNLSTRIRCESCLILRMSMLTIFNINNVSGVVLGSLLLTVNFVLIAHFEQAKVCLVYIEKTHTFEDKNGHIIRYAVGLKVLTKFIHKLRLNLCHHNTTSESARNFCAGVYFRRRFWLKRCSSHSK